MTHELADKERYEDKCYEEDEIQRCRCGELMSYSRTLLMELNEYHWACMECGWTLRKALTVKDEVKCGKTQKDCKDFQR